MSQLALVLTGLFVIGASLSQPHTSELSGMSVAFTKIYKVIWINGCVCKCLEMDKTRLLTSASGMSVHYTKNYVSLQAFLRVRVTLGTKIIYPNKF